MLWVRKSGEHTASLELRKQQGQVILKVSGLKVKERNSHNVLGVFLLERQWMERGQKDPNNPDSG